MSAKQLFRPCPLRSFRPSPSLFPTGFSFRRSAAMAFSQTAPSRGQRPRDFPTSGFRVIEPSERVEEERLPFYKQNEYYPMHIGDVVSGHYQIVAKLGYGTSSTVWLAHDLWDGKYWALKVHANTIQIEHSQELQVYQHLESFMETQKGNEEIEKHPGRQNIHQLKDGFLLQGPHGQHVVFVMTPLGMSLKTLQELQPTGVFQRLLVIGSLRQVFLGLSFLHQADVIHTDLYADNLLVAMTDDSILSKVEETEMNKPSARKIVDGTTTIHTSQHFLGGAGSLTITDLGQARIGSEHTGPAMPVPYRAPEVILGMPWGPAVDLWSVALLAWGLLERESLFRVYDKESPELNDAHHLAAMIALMGPPPAEFLKRSETTQKYWDEDGQWKGPVPLPPKKTLESLATALTGEDKAQFVDLVDCYLCWLPEERPEPLQGFFHPWLGSAKPC